MRLVQSSDGAALLLTSDQRGGGAMNTAMVIRHHGETYCLPCGKAYTDSWMCLAWLYEGVGKAARCADCGQSISPLGQPVTRKRGGVVR